MTDRIEWLKERQKGIGGSDVAAILGLNPYRTPLDVYLSKKEEDVKDEMSQAAYWGTQLEETVAKEFSKRTGLKVQRVNHSFAVGPDGWMRANIDRAVINPDIAKIVRVIDDDKIDDSGRLITTDTILECKTASSFNSKDWGPSQEEEIISGTVVSEHKIPLYYETQIQWYMGVVGAETCYVAVLIGGQDFRIYQVKRDRDLFENLVAHCITFWEDHVLKDIPPEATNAADVKKLFAKDNGEMEEASNEAAALIGEIRNVKARIDELTTTRKELEADLIAQIGERLGFTIAGEKAVTYKAQNTTRFDVTAFKAENPETYLRYAKTKTTRVLRVA